MRPLEWRLFEAGYCTHPERMTRRGGRWCNCQFPALTALIRHPQYGPILFDTGYSEAFMEATAPLPERLYRMVTPVRLETGRTLREQLRRQGLEPADIGLIVLSHLHGDHIAGVRDFPDVPLLCSSEAWDDMRRRGRIGALRKGLLPALIDSAKDRLQWLEQRPEVRLAPPFAAFGMARDVLGDGSLLAVPLPGHGAGQHGLLFREPSERPVFLVADAVWSSQAIRDGVPPPGWVTGLLGDTGEYRRTLARLHALSLDAPEVRIVPSHCVEWRPDV
ncbi:MAG: MBL fold metallo-hydrolase [Xanthomonadaceae bacterium]|jgi:glyoxylase-like metal-dependent hydrolase (beta-lactamase superfamily II)|nr:MBL fold metallo-hydrolase [Xanthomonadaceae bacterium]